MCVCVCACACVRAPFLSRLRVAGAKDSLDFTVYDEDTGKSDDFLGKCTLRFDDSGLCLTWVPTSTLQA